MVWSWWCGGGVVVMLWCCGRGGGVVVWCENWECSM